MVTMREKIVEGASKILYEHSEPGTALLHFQDPLPEGPESTKGLGIINAGLSALLMQRFDSIGLATHFIKVHNSREHWVRLVETFPIFVSVHNIASWAFGKRLGIAEGAPLSRNIVEFHLKDHALENPLVTQEHASCFGWCSASEWDEMATIATRINDFLIGQLSALHFDLFSFRVEFGRLYSTSPDDYQLVICDEISLKTCALRDVRTGVIHRASASPSAESTHSFYQEVARRFGILSEVCSVVPGRTASLSRPPLTVIR